MFVMSNKGNTCVNTIHVTDFSVKKSDKLNSWVVVAGLTTKGLPILGDYLSEESAQIALGRLFFAIDEGKSSFTMPEPEEVNFARQNHGTMTSRKLSHGGS